MNPVIEEALALLIALVQNAGNVSAFINNLRGSGREPTAQELQSLRDAAVATIDASLPALDAAIARAQAEGR